MIVAEIQNALEGYAPVASPDGIEKRVNGIAFVYTRTDAEPYTKKVVIMAEEADMTVEESE